MRNQAFNDEYFKLIKPGLRVFFSFTRETTLSLPNLIEEVLDNRELIAQMPSNAGTYHYIQPNEAFALRFVDGLVTYDADAEYLDRIKKQNMVFAKIRLTSPVRLGRSRSYFRLSYSTNVSLNFTHVMDNLEISEGMTIDISGTGMLLVTNAEFEVGDRVPLEFNIGSVEHVEAEVLRVDRLDKNAAFKYKVALHFLESSPAQQERIHKYLVTKQLESRKSLMSSKPLLTRGDAVRAETKATQK